ncbi:MAG TPA: hypothetical protein VGN08_09540 [Solirubrobacteraceae bacterium]|jgi:hypothetical protein
MISSEVQRTLVKSPPELWTELSDPAALSRHLGELGEIRITRVEPEKTVEWEADHATGTVLIKPSGWGTRVTLTVTREVPAPEQASGAEEPEPSPAVADEDRGPGETVQTEPEADSSLGAEAAAPEEELSLAADVAAAPEEEHSPVAEEEGWEDPEWAYEPESELESDAEPEAEPEAEFEPDAEPELDPEPMTEPRRGFLARLFGRRRRPGGQAPPAAPEVEADPDNGTVLEAGGGRDAADGLDSGPPFDPYVAARAEEAIVEWQAEDEDAVAPGWQGPATPAMEAVRQPQPATAAAAAAAAAASAAAAAAENPVAEPPGTDWESDAGAEQPPAEQPVDISAELRAAEETAAEEVTALLTSMLDRLGTAHHRPFSRA